MSGIELQLDLITAAEYGEAVIRMNQQIADIPEACVSANGTRERSGRAHLVVDEFKFARRLIFPHPRVAMKGKPRACQRHIYYFDRLRLLWNRCHQDLTQ